MRILEGRAEPRIGFRVFDKAANCFRHFDGSWQRPTAPAAPSGGTTVDAEARATLANILQKLVAAGIFATS